jgi:hypothetical protein
MLTEITETIDAMVVAAAEEGMPDAELARELAKAALTVLADDPTPVHTLTEMIDHRRFHWPSHWGCYHGSSAVLARALVRVFRERWP